MCVLCIEPSLYDHFIPPPSHRCVGRVIVHGRGGTMVVRVAAMKESGGGVSDVRSALFSLLLFIFSHLATII